LGNESDSSTEQWFGASDFIPCSLSCTVLDLSTNLVVNIDLGSGKSVSAAVSSVQDSDFANHVSLVELDLPPLVDTSVGMSEL